MSDEEIAALRKRIEQLEGKVDPPKSTFKPMTDAEHRDWVYQMQERRMSMATPPSVIRDFAVLDDKLCAGIRADRHAPSSASGMIPQSRPSGPSGEREKSSTPGYVDPRPLGPQPGIDLIDRAVNAALPHGPEWGKK